MNIILQTILDLRLLILQITQFELTELLLTTQKRPRFPILTERFINNNDLLSNKRKGTELKRLQPPNLEIKFEVKVKFQGFNPHPVFHVAKIEHKTTPAPFEVVHTGLERDSNLPSLPYGKIVFYNPYSGLEYTTSF